MRSKDNEYFKNAKVHKQKQKQHAKQFLHAVTEDAGHNNIGHYDAYWSAQKRFCLKVSPEQLILGVADTDDPII